MNRVGPARLGYADQLLVRELTDAEGREFAAITGILDSAEWQVRGGPCRLVNEDHSGVDLTREFCEAAEALNLATGLADRVRIIRGSALALPVPDGAFDAAYSQNVIMNIADKALFYREAFRGLRPGGRLALSNLCAGAGEPHYPVPWATTSETSFLATPEEMRADLVAAGFEIADFRDTTAAIQEAQQRNRERLQQGTLPRVAADIILGERAREMQINSLRNTEEGRCAMVEALVRKPG